MIDRDQLDKAIAAHGFWMIHLRKAVEQGTSEFQPETVTRDDRCEFGAWFHGLPQEDRFTERWRTVRDLHAEFHKEAARVLGLALGGRKSDARAALAADGSFARVSDELTLALMAWKRSLTP